MICRIMCDLWEFADVLDGSPPEVARIVEIVRWIDIKEILLLNCRGWRHIDHI